jgi:hypothetical protein
LKLKLPLVLHWPPPLEPMPGPVTVEQGWTGLLDCIVVVWLDCVALVYVDCVTDGTVGAVCVAAVRFGTDGGACDAVRLGTVGAACDGCASDGTVGATCDVAATLGKVGVTCEVAATFGNVGTTRDGGGTWTAVFAAPWAAA